MLNDALLLRSPLYQREVEEGDMIRGDGQAVRFQHVVAVLIHGDEGQWDRLGRIAKPVVVRYAGYGVAAVGIRCRYGRFGTVAVRKPAPCFGVRVEVGFVPL